MKANPFTLHNKQILITGASSGIGRAMAVECAKAGAKLIITGRNEERLNETFVQLEGEGHQCFIADLNRVEDVEGLVNCVDVLDGVISNAGINKRQLTKYLKADDMQLILQTNLISPILLVKNLLKRKKLNNCSSIVFTSSIAAFHSSVGDGVYSATKGGISSFARVLALELGGNKIRVNSIQPGMVRTSLLNHGPLSEDDYQKDEQRYPLGRYGKPEEVAYAAIYLLSDAAQWITGTNLVIDGGISLI